MNNSIKISELIIPDKYKIQYKILYGDYCHASNYILFREIINILFKECEYESFIPPITYREIIDFMGLLGIPFTVTSNNIYDKITVTRLIS